MPFATISALNIYPVKSCAGISLTHAPIATTGLLFDRHWMIVADNGRFLSQRDVPKMALIKPRLREAALELEAPGMDPLDVRAGTQASVEVQIWQDRCAALDQGSEAAAWLSKFLGCSVRLVKFDSSCKRVSGRQWTGDVEALTEFADGYALLALSEASLSDLNRRLSQPLPIERFRPNLVLRGLDAYDEDRIDDLTAGDIRLRVVKPCTRCKITTVDQVRGEVQGQEPLSTLKTYRLDRELRGVTFGQNVIVIAGAGNQLEVGQSLEIKWK